MKKDGDGPLIPGLFEITGPVPVMTLFSPVPPSIASGLKPWPTFRYAWEYACLEAQMPGGINRNFDAEPKLLSAKGNVLK